MQPDNRKHVSNLMSSPSICSSSPVQLLRLVYQRYQISEAFRLSHCLVSEWSYKKHFCTVTDAYTWMTSRLSLQCHIFKLYKGVNLRMATIHCTCKFMWTNPKSGPQRSQNEETQNRMTYLESWTVQLHQHQQLAVKLDTLDRLVILSTPPLISAEGQCRSGSRKLFNKFKRNKPMTPETVSEQWNHTHDID